MWLPLRTAREGMAGEILCERDGSVASVTLSNPDKLNAVDAGMWRALKRVIDELSADDDLRCVVLQGAGDKAFAAGGDIEEFLTLRDTLDQALVYHGEWVAGALNAVAECRHPTLAMIRGACIGGGLEIAGACDLRLAGESATFGAPINRLGFTMYHGELAGLLALSGPAVALEILLEGRILRAREAYEKGLVTRVVADDRLAAETGATVDRIRAGAPLVARAHKKLVRRLGTRSAPLTADEIRESLAYLETEDYRTGMRAFLEKKPPRFTGR